ncbi:MAG: hypothetical protein Unbinned97contig1000_25 [Prokaryotic dsDNA virus sp.]|nr:MAG: hypothetical protein Unbinned97contig1000_25 [Prokaryotic dsDNA virus sp.]|tara:strand:+ start:1769 stop:2377 length:609 start_codon:yes stop_codon:yes gene_type:complete
MSKEKISVWETLSRIDCSKHVEKKGRFSYLSWAWAWSILKENYPTASFEYIKTENGGTAFVDSDGYAFVRVAVTVENQTVIEDLAVMDNYNKDILNPKPTDINNTLKRCLVKAMAFHGLGINVYAGEDTLMFDNKEPVDKIELTQDTKKDMVDSIKSYMTKNPKWQKTVLNWSGKESVYNFTNEQLITTYNRIPETKLEEVV